MSAVDAALFYGFSALALAGAVGTVACRNAVHSALALIVSLLGVAGLFLGLAAEFLAAVQVITYVGGVVMLFLFVILLVNLDRARRERQYVRFWWLGLAVAGGVAVELALLLGRGAAGLPPVATGQGDAVGNTEALADRLLSDYLVPFELASLLLLVAMIGAVLMGRSTLAARRQS